MHLRDEEHDCQSHVSCHVPTTFAHVDHARDGIDVERLNFEGGRETIPRTRMVAPNKRESLATPHPHRPHEFM